LENEEGEGRKEGLSKQGRTGEAAGIVAGMKGGERVEFAGERRGELDLLVGPRRRHTPSIPQSEQRAL